MGVKQSARLIMYLVNVTALWLDKLHDPSN